MEDWVLLIEKGDEMRQRVPLVVFPHVLGRAGHADTGFESPHVSRRHAEVLESGPSLLIRDLGSLNGTFVNDERTDSSGTVLKPNDRITLGKGVVVLRVISNEKTIFQDETSSDPGPIQIDRGTHDVRVAGKLVSPPLAHKEFEVLALLAGAYRQFYPNQEIARAGWPERFGDVSDLEIQQIIKRLRNRIGPDLIENRRNVGYRLA